MSDSEVSLDPGIVVALNAGDLAARCRNADVLSQAARDLYPVVAAPIQMELADIAKLAHRDIAAAAARWANVSAHLRAHVLIATSRVGNLDAKA